MRVLAARGPYQDSEVYHLPSEDNPDRPECDHNGRKDTEFTRFSSDALPNRRLCKQCSGEQSMNRQTGTQTATRLSKMDPDDIGGPA